MLRENLKPATREFRDLGAQLDAPILLKNPSFFSRFRTRRFLFAHELGFRIQFGSRHTDVSFSEINALSIKKSEIYSSGRAYGISYFVTVVIGSRMVRFKHLASGDDGKDPFTVFLNRTVSVLADRFTVDQNLQGRDWSLDNQGFRWKDGIVSWAEIGYVDVVDHRVCIWKAGDIFPLLRLDDADPQAWILNEILERYTRKHSQQLSGDSLGRSLFFRKANKALVKIILLLAFALLVTGVWLLLEARAAALPAFLLFFLGGPVALYLVFTLRRTFHFFQYGIIQEPGHKVLFYNQCESLVYDTSLQFINGIYAFTRILMNIHSSACTMKIKIQCYGSDLEMEQARIEASTRIAERLYQKVAAQGEVAWGEWARIAPHEVNYLSTPLLGSNTRFAIPFTQPISYSMDSGKFYLFRAGEPNPIFEMDCNEENFYPGLFLLLRLVAEH